MKSQTNRESQLGFTLVEILAVLLLLGVIGAVAVPRFVNLTNEAKNRMIDRSIGELNTREKMAWGRIKLLNNALTDQAFDTEVYNLVAPDVDLEWRAGPNQQDGGRIMFRSHHVQLRREAATLSTPGFWERIADFFTFNGTGHFELDELGNFTPTPLHGSPGWEITASGLRSQGTGQNLLYMDVDPDEIGREYAITVNAAMNEGPGYGILFDTTGQGIDETGFSLQYERAGGGRIIIRPRIDGNENLSNHRESIDENHYLWESIPQTERDRFLAGEISSPVLHRHPLSDAQKALLEEGHTLRAEVRDADDGQRRVEVFLGGEWLFDKTYRVADPDNPITTTGLRVWQHGDHTGDDVRFSSFDIRGL